MLPKEILNKEIIDFAHQLADIASVISKKYYRSHNGEISKDDGSPVTKADREIEMAIREAIVKKFPNHGIIGEEFGNHQEFSNYVWIIDPIDGTSSFIVGRPIFGNLIALAYKKEVILGIINQPITEERWIGLEQEGSWLNSDKIQTRFCFSVAEAVMCSSSPFFFRGEDEKVFKKLSALTKYQHLGGVVYGGDCYSYACLASGFVDIIIEPELKVFDFASHIPIIKNAGGVISDWQGNELKLESGARLLACSTKELHAEVVKILNES